MNTSLETLDLQGVTMGPSGGHAIADGIRANASIRELILELDPADGAIAEEIANALRSNTTLTEIFLGDGGSLAPEVAESFANTLRINKFIAGVSAGNRAGVPAPGEAPTADDVVLAMNQRLLEVQGQLQQAQDQPPPAPTAPHSASRRAQRSPADSLGKAQISSAIKEAKRGRAALQGATKPPERKARGHSRQERRDDGERAGATPAHGDEAGAEAVGGARLSILEAQVAACQASLESRPEMSAAGAAGGGFRAELEALEERMQAYHDNAIRRMEERLRDEKRSLIQEELAAAVEGITEALRNDWEDRWRDLELRMASKEDAKSYVEELRESATAQTVQAAVEKAMQDTAYQLAARVEVLEASAGVAGSGGEAAWQRELKRAVEQLKEESVWAEEEGIRLRVEEEARYNRQLEEVREMQVKSSQALMARCESLERTVQDSSVKQLEKELKEAHQASLRALQAKAATDYRVVEDRMGELQDRLGTLEVTMRNEQEASLMALEAILETL